MPVAFLYVLFLEGKYRKDPLSEVMLRMPSSSFFIAGWRRAIADKKLESEIFYSVALENVDSDVKRKTYDSFFGGIIVNEGLSIRERYVIEGAVIDSILDEINYIPYDVFKDIAAIFQKRSIVFEPVFNKMAFLMNRYARLFGYENEYHYDWEENTDSLYIGNEVLEKKMREISDYNYRSIGDYRNNSIVFENKRDVII